MFLFDRFHKNNQKYTFIFNFKRPDRIDVSKMTASIIRKCKFGEGFSYSYYLWTLDGRTHYEVTVQKEKIIYVDEPKDEKNGWQEIQINYSTIKTTLEDLSDELSEELANFYRMVLEQFPPKPVKSAIMSHKNNKSVRIWFGAKSYADLVLDDGTVLTIDLLQADIDLVKMRGESKFAFRNIYFKNDIIYLNEIISGFDSYNYEPLSFESITLLSKMRFPYSTCNGIDGKRTFPLIVKYVDFTKPELGKLTEEGFVIRDKMFFTLVDSRYDLNTANSLCRTCSDCEEITILDNCLDNLQKIIEKDGEQIRCCIHEDSFGDVHKSIQSSFDFNRPVTPESFLFLQNFTKYVQREEQEANRFKSLFYT